MIKWVATGLGAIGVGLAGWTLLKNGELTKTVEEQGKKLDVAQAAKTLAEEAKKLAEKMAKLKTTDDDGKESKEDGGDDDDAHEDERWRD